MDKRSSPVDNLNMETQPDPNQFTRDAWDANAEVWDARMGDEGNDFFNIRCAPNFGKTILTYTLHTIMHIKSLKESSVLLILYSF